jgi:hypothetical protein
MAQKGRYTETLDDLARQTRRDLGAIIPAVVEGPERTTALLRRPPFRFLHDVISAVTRATGFAEGLFDGSELSTDHLHKDKYAKEAYLRKIIKCVEEALGQKLEVRPDRVVRGLEPENTNLFLQALALAADGAAWRHGNAATRHGAGQPASPPPSPPAAEGRGRRGARRSSAVGAESGESWFEDGPLAGTDALRRSSTGVGQKPPRRAPPAAGSGGPPPVRPGYVRQFVTIVLPVAGGPKGRTFQVTVDGIERMFTAPAGMPRGEEHEFFFDVVDPDRKRGTFGAAFFDLAVLFDPEEKKKNHRWQKREGGQRRPLCRRLKDCLLCRRRDAAVRPSQGLFGGPNELLETTHDTNGTASSTTAGGGVPRRPSVLDAIVPAPVAETTRKLVFWMQGESSPPARRERQRRLSRCLGSNGDAHACLQGAGTAPSRPLRRGPTKVEGANGGAHWRIEPQPAASPGAARPASFANLAGLQEAYSIWREATAALAAGPSPEALLRSVPIEVLQTPRVLQFGVAAPTDKRGRPLQPAAPPQPRNPAARLWRSVRFWRAFPWGLALSLIAACGYFTVLFGLDVFDECPQAIATSQQGLPAGWAWTVVFSLLLSWAVFDPAHILLRNNWQAMKTALSGLCRRAHRAQQARRPPPGVARSKHRVAPVSCAVEW